MLIYSFNTIALIVLIYFNLSAQKIDSIRTHSLEEITIVANRIKSNPKDLFTKVEIINSEKIQDINGFNLSDKIKHSPSVFIKSYGASSSLQSISINGLGAEHTVILLDGVKINSFQNSMFDLSLMSTENIACIEILNNGASSIYGSEAISGIVNLITKNKFYYSDNKPFLLSSSLSYGSFNSYRYSFNISKNFDKLITNVFYSREKSDGNFEYVFDNGINQLKKKRENSHYSLNDIGFNFNLIIDSSNRFQILSTYVDSYKEIPGMEIGTPPTESNQRDRNWNNILVFESLFSKFISLKTSLNYQNNLMNYYLKPFVKSFYKNYVYSYSNDLSFNTDFFTSVFGYNYTFAQLKSNEIDDGVKRNQHSVYLSSSTNISENLRIFPSARFDYISDINKHVLTYQLGFNLKPLQDYEIKIRGNIGKNFRAPTFNDLCWKDSGNKNLSPEFSTNKELGLLYEYDKVFSYLIELTFINIKATNKIVWLPTNNFLWMPVNIASSNSNSLLFNFSFSNPLFNHASMKFDLGINYIESFKTSENFKDDPTKNKYFPYLPKLSIKSGMSIKLQSIKINLFYSHYGNRFSDFENLKPLNSINLLDGNIILSLNFLDLNSSLKFEMNNITNVNYQIISGYPMPLRNYRITLSFNY